MPPGIIANDSAQAIARGVLLLSQANYAAARTCLQLYDGFSRLGVKKFPAKAMEHVKKNKVPPAHFMIGYWQGAVEPLRSIPDRHGPAIVSGRRDTVIEGIKKYVRCIQEATELRDAISHGPLTRSEEGELLVHHTGGETSVMVLAQHAERFLRLSLDAYSGAVESMFNLPGLLIINWQFIDHRSSPDYPEED